MCPILSLFRLPRECTGSRGTTPLRPCSLLPAPLRYYGAVAEVITVRLKLLAELGRLRPEGGREAPFRLPAGSRAEDLLLALGLADRDGIVVGRNGALAQRSTPLADGDRVDVMTAMEGGAGPSRAPRS